MSLHTQSRINKDDGVEPQEDFEYVITADTFRYRGSVTRLEQKLDALHTTRNKEFNDVKIKILGNLVKERNTTCQLTTLFFGILLVFPIFFMCCKWWRKIVYPAYQIPESTYKKLSYILETPTICSIGLKVTDSAFNQQKTKILYNILQSSLAQKFRFTNQATPNDFREREYTNFEDYVELLKKLKMKIQIKWCDKIFKSAANEGVKEHVRDPDDK